MSAIEIEKAKANTQRELFARGPDDKTGLLVLLALAHAADRDGWCAMSYPELARRARMSRASAMRKVKELEAAGWLTVLRVGRQSTMSVSEFQEALARLSGDEKRQVLRVAERHAAIGTEGANLYRVRTAPHVAAA